jgi:hypothetical protein
MLRTIVREFVRARGWPQGQSDQFELILNVTADHQFFQLIFSFRTIAILDRLPEATEIVVSAVLRGEQVQRPHPSRGRDQVVVERLRAFVALAERERVTEAARALTSRTREPRDCGLGTLLEGHAILPPTWVRFPIPLRGPMNRKHGSHSSKTSIGRIERKGSVSRARTCRSAYQGRSPCGSSLSSCALQLP